MTLTARLASLIATATLVTATAAAQDPAPAAPAASGEVATVQSTNGKVLLNRGADYKPAVKGQRLSPGDRLVVLEGGAVGVRYDKGCEQNVNRQSVYTINSDQICEAAALDRGLRAPAAAGASEGVTSASVMKWGLIGLGIAAPIYIIATNTQGSPISP